MLGALLLALDLVSPTQVAAQTSSECPSNFDEGFVAVQPAFFGTHAPGTPVQVTYSDWSISTRSFQMRLGVSGVPASSTTKQCVAPDGRTLYYHSATAQGTLITDPGRQGGMHIWWNEAQVFAGGWHEWVYHWVIEYPTGQTVDTDGDVIPDTSSQPNGADNCPAVANVDQWDSDRDGIGDACEPNQEEYNYVALGDSFVSGQGTYVYDPETDTETNECHRSPLAYPFQAGWTGEVVSFACSGAIINDFYFPNHDGNANEGPQLTRFDTYVAEHSVEVVTVGIGGNDVQFAPVLTTCVAPLNDCEEEWTDSEGIDLDVLVPQVADRLDDVYRDVKARALGATVIVVGYPVFMSENYKCALGESGISVKEQRWIRALIVDFNERIAAAAYEADVHYLAAQPAYQDHELCRDGTTSGNYMNGVVPPPEAFHPKAAGHAALGVRLTGCLHGRTTNCGRDLSPVARAGADVTVSSGTNVALNGGASTDPAGQPLTYLWWTLSGPNAVIDNKRSQQAVLRGVTGPTTIRVRLTVTDPYGLTHDDDLIITVRAPAPK